MRIGNGFDVHAFAEQRKLILGGVEIEYDRGLLGHSDADVLVHAIMDALLGALALGDIGKHFPDTDPKYKNSDSMLLLEGVMDLVNERRYKVGNIDAVVIAQKPKLAPHIEKMRINTAIDRAEINSALVDKKNTEMQKNQEIETFLTYMIV